MTTNVKEKISFDTNVNKYKYFKYEYFFRAFLNYLIFTSAMSYTFFSYLYKFDNKAKKNIFFTHTLLFIDLSLWISLLVSLYHSWKEEKNEEIEIYCPFFVRYSIYIFSIILCFFAKFISEKDDKFIYTFNIYIFVLYVHYLWKKTKCDSEEKKVYYRLFLIVLLISIFLALNIICIIIEPFFCNGIIKNFLIFIDDCTTLIYVLIFLYLFVYLAIKDYEKQKKQMIMKKKRTLFKYFLFTFHIFSL